MQSTRPNQMLAITVGVCLAAGCAASADLEAQGEYLATAAGCSSCHTADGGGDFAGGKALDTPFGTLRSPNITPDVDTGIGSWNRQDFTKALREGTRKDGQPLYPAMPYAHYTGIEDDEIAALWAYFRSVPPVSNEVEVNHLPFPFDVRASLIGWKALFFDAGRFEPDASLDGMHNRGVYLVQALGHCSSCHTPRNRLGAEDHDRYLEGAQVAPWYAPDISNGSGSVLRDYTVDSLAAFLAGKHQAGNRAPIGKMSEVVFDSLSKLAPEDVHAIAVYLKDREGGEAPPPAGEPVELSVDALMAGTAVYAQNCASCHGDDGEGRAGVGARLAGSATVADGPPDNGIAVVLKGVAPRGGWSVMPSFAEELSDVQIAQVMNFIRTNWQNEATVAANAANVAAARKLVDVASSGAGAATTCPSVPDANMDEATRSALDRLDPDSISAASLRPIVEAHASAHAGLNQSQRILALTGTFCATLSEKTDDDKALMHDELAFMNSVGDLVSN